MSATEVIPGPGGSIGVQGFFQVNDFSVFQAAGSKLLPIDGQFHDLEYSLTGLANMNVVDQTGVNLFSHPTEVVINVDLIRFIGLKIKSIERSGQNIILKFLTEEGQMYVIEYSPNLSPGSWNDLPGSNIVGDGQEATVTDMNAVANAGTRFYRLKLSQ